MGNGDSKNKSLQNNKRYEACVEDADIIVDYPMPH